MGQLVEILYPLPDRRRTALSNLVWWESKRLTYNKAVGGAGLVTLATMTFFFSLPPFPEPPPLGFLVIGATVWCVRRESRGASFGMTETRRAHASAPPSE